MLYKFAGPSSRQKSAESQVKALALSPAAAGASPSPASATAPDVAAPDARQALCTSFPGTSTPGTAAEVYDYLITDPDRATEIAIVATELQDASVQRLDAAPPPLAASAEDEDAAEDNDLLIHTGTPGQRVRRKRRRASAPQGEAAAAGASSAEPAESAALVSSPARSYRRADATNQFVLKFPVNSGSGVKLGQAITISALLIQGPFPKEDKTDHQEHRRQVQSAMLNVYSDGQIAAFVAAGLKFQEEMQLYCRQRVEVSRVTKQRAVASLQKFLNATFFSSNGCTAEHRGTRDFIMIALRLSINVWLFGAAHIGFEGAASILHRWKNDDGSNKYDRLCPDCPKASRTYPCKSEPDGRAVTILASNLLRLDARHPYRDGAGHDPLRPGNKPLALFGATSPKYWDCPKYWA